MSEYPEHDKLTAIRDESQAIGEFLTTCGYVLCAWRNGGNNGEPEYVWGPRTTKALRDGKQTEERAPTLTDLINGDANHNPLYEEWSEGFLPVRGGTEEILARHFGIDLTALDREKRAMLNQIRGAA